MLNLIPDVLFWIKDADNHFVYGNQAFLEHQGIRAVGDLAGKTDFDFSPAHLAAQYVRDDQTVLQGGEVTNRLEMNTTDGGEIAWFATTKRPILTDAGDVVGTFGMTRHFGRFANARSDIEAVREPVEFVRANYATDISVTDIASAAHLSVSALERRFKKHLKKTPRRFLVETRLEQARRLLVESDLPIAEVAYSSGFLDHSYFSQQFRRFWGLLPSEFRRSHATGDRMPNTRNRSGRVR
ncbi:MAG: AraC family transcriptional regulator [Pseudomonadota bacterium]